MLNSAFFRWFIWLYAKCVVSLHSLNKTNKQQTTMEKDLKAIIAAAKAAAEKEVVTNVELDEDGNPESGDYPEELFFEYGGQKYVAVVENLDFDCNVWHSQGDNDVPESCDVEVAWTEIKATIYYDGGEDDGDKVTEFSHKW